MADDGASVGSIKGLLQLDISDYMDNMQQAKAAEQDLTSGDRDVTIGANVEDAIAKIEDVDGKARELDASDTELTVGADVEDAMGRLDEVRAKADETGDSDPDIRVDANVDDAQAKLDAVAAKGEELDSAQFDARVEAKVDDALIEIDAVADAAQSLDAKPARVQVDADTGKAVTQITAVTEAETALRLSTARLQAAYERLDAVQSEDVSSQSALMTAEAAATRMEDEHAAAQERLNAACRQYKVRMVEDTAAVSQSVSAMQADVDATGEDTAAKRANSTAAGTQTASARSLTSALLLVAPALVPIAGAAAGAGVSLVAMAAVGVLAVKGISMAMSDGSVTGQQYSADIQSLASDLTRLERTGAVSFLSGMNTMTGEVNAKMPFLSTATATYSRDLGTISGNTVAGVLNLFEQLTPVTLEVDQGLVRASQSFRNWGSGSGAKEFVSYLLQQLPIVSTALGSLGNAIGHVIVAFSPIGDVVLEAVTGLSDAIGAIPTPLLTVLAAGALGAYAGFKSWQLISPIIDGVKAAMEGLDGASLLSMVTPIGAVVAAVGLLGAAFMAFSDKTKIAAGAQEDFLQALEKSNGVIDENVRATVAKSAADSDMTSLSSKVGVSANQVTDAILNEGDAYDSIKKKVDANVSAADRFRTQNGYNSKSLTDTANASSSLLDKLDQLRGKYSSAASQQKFLASASADASTTLNNQAQIIGVSESQWDALSSAEASASTAAKDYKSALDALDGQSQTLDQATNTLTVQFDTMASTIKSNIKSVGSAQATSMDNNTLYGAKNHALILQTVQDAQSKADAIINSEGKSQKSYEDARASLETSRQKILQVARANGLNTDAVSKYLDQVMKLPADAKTSIILDDSEAVGGLKELQVKTAEVTSDGKHVTITGDNKDALKSIADVVGAKIDKKTGSLTLDKQQYDTALAVANGAKIDEKTGQLLGNNSPLFQKVAEANGWTIDEKTGQIKGSDGQYLSVKNAVDAIQIADKIARILANDQASGTIYSIKRELDSITDKTVTVRTYQQSIQVGSVGTGMKATPYWTGGTVKGYADGGSFLPGYADGGAFDGAVTGPDSPIKDNVILRNARLNPGEHVLTVDDVKAMGGQKAVYAFRSSLHQSQSTGYTGGDTSGSNATGKTGGGVSLPESITLVDADGSILAKVRAIVGEANGRRNTSLVRALVN